MPIYEYACRECGQDFEKFVRSAAITEVITCPTCQSDNVKKRLSTFAAKVSGGGYSAGASAPSCSPSGT